MFIQYGRRFWVKNTEFENEAFIFFSFFLFFFFFFIRICTCLYNTILTLLSQNKWIATPSTSQVLDDMLHEYFLITCYMNIQTVCLLNDFFFQGKISFRPDWPFSLFLHIVLLLFLDICIFVYMEIKKVMSYEYVYD